MDKYIKRKRKMQRGAAAGALVRMRGRTTAVALRLQSVPPLFSKEKRSERIPGEGAVRSLFLKKRRCRSVCRCYGRAMRAKSRKSFAP